MKYLFQMSIRYSDVTPAGNSRPDGERAFSSVGKLVNSGIVDYPNVLQSGNKVILKQNENGGGMQLEVNAVLHLPEKGYAIVEFKDHHKIGSLSEAVELVDKTAKYWSFIEEMGEKIEV